MKGSMRGVALVVAVGLALRVWAAYGPFLVSAGPFQWPTTPEYRTVSFVLYLFWVAVTAIAYRQDPHGRLWKLMLLYVATDGVWALSYLGPLGDAVAGMLLLSGQAVLVHMVLAFPSGHLRDRFDRWFVVLVYVVALPLWSLRSLVWDPQATCPDCSPNLLLIVRNDELAYLVTRLGLAAPAFAAIAIFEVVRHWWAASPAGRRALAPVAFAMPLVFAIWGVWWLALTLDRKDITDLMYRYYALDIPSFAVPTLFLIGILRARLARGSVADLARELGRGIPLGGLRDALAQTLRDPTLQLAFETPGGGGQLVDSEGRPFTMPPPADRTVTRLERNGELIAVLVHDPAIDREDEGLVAAVGSVARLALENERLSAQVRAQLEEVRASRQRIVEAGDAERHRIERDLHDGAQQRLVALAMRLEAARSQASDAQSIIDATTAELGVAIDEVRQLARGVHPAILTEAGLAAAVESLAERMPIPIELEAEDARFPASIEATAYFVITESITNAVKHAGASHATVRLRRQGSQLVVEVADDGRGGADPSAGSGLRGLADRVAAAGGTIEVTSPSGAGTTIRARLPLVEEPG